MRDQDHYHEVCGLRDGTRILPIPNVFQWGRFDSSRLYTVVVIKSEGNILAFLK